MQGNQWPRNPVLTFWQSKRICSDNACGNRTKRSDSQPRPSRLNFQSYSRLNARFSFSCARAVCLGVRRDCAYFLRRRSSGQRRSWVVCLRPPCALLSCASFGRLDCSPSLVPQRSKSIQSVQDGCVYRKPHPHFKELRAGSFRIWGGASASA